MAIREDTQARAVLLKNINLLHSILGRPEIAEARRILHRGAYAWYREQRGQGAFGLPERIERVRFSYGKVYWKRAVLLNSAELSRDELEVSPAMGLDAFLAEEHKWVSHGKGRALVAP
jgi:hypothetical protein